MKKLINSWGGNVCSAMYIASHGSKGSFILNDGRIRSYGWLDELLDKIPARITVIIDSCYSGSARPFLAQEGRDVYTSVGADELSTGEYDRRFAEALGGVEADVDGDGVVEMWEADRWGRGVRMTIRLGTDFRTDSDGDGLTDDEEEDYFKTVLGKSDSWFKEDMDGDNKTNGPQDPDTDGDGLYDGWKDDGDEIWENGETFGEIGDISLSSITSIIVDKNRIEIYPGSIGHLLYQNLGNSTEGLEDVGDELPDPLGGADK